MSRELFLANIREAFTSGEVKVDKSLFLINTDGQFSGCAVGAAQYKTGNPYPTLVSYISHTAKEYNLTRDYVAGVSIGFSHNYLAVNSVGSDEFINGREDGKQLWEEFKHLS